MLSNFFPFTVHVLLGLLCFAESVHEAVLKSTAALKTDLDEERRKYQGLLRDFSRLEQRYDNLREMSLLTEVQNCAHTCDRSEQLSFETKSIFLFPQSTKGHRRTDSTQSLSFEPLSPSLTLSGSPFTSIFPSPDDVRRVSVTSPTLDRRAAWSTETPMVSGCRF